jgi:hypothetical protein
MYDREHQARKTSLEDNVTDVFVHQNASSDPFVRTFDSQVKQQKPKYLCQENINICLLMHNSCQPRCTRCGSVEHHTVSCPTKRGELAVTGSDDNIFNSLVVLDGEDEPQDQKKYLRELQNSWRA